MEFALHARVGIGMSMLTDFPPVLLCMYMCVGTFVCMSACTAVFVCLHDSTQKLRLFAGEGHVLDNRKLLRELEQTIPSGSTLWLEYT